jgi:heat shock protein HtpX
MNGFKTFMLIALMTGLLIVLGDVFYGRDGAILALIAGLAINAFSYFFSDRIVLMTYRAKIVTRQDAPQLYTVVESLAMRAGLPMPRVAIVPDQTPNAFATGRNPNRAVVAVTEGILRALSPAELEGVLAHELGHVKHRDILIGSLAAVLSQAIMFLSRMAYWMSPRDRDRSASPIAAMAVMILAPLAALILQMAISRGREYMADEFSAKITGRPDQLASALEKISGYNKQKPMQSAEPTSAHMMIVNPLSGSSLASLFSTHPPIKKRIERLEAMRGKFYSSSTFCS